MTPRTKRYYWRYLVLLPAVLALAACGLLGGEPEEATPVAATSIPTDVPAEVPDSQPAAVETIDILVLESFPVQVNVIVSGNLPNGCSTLGEPRPRREGNTFVINLVASRLPDEPCTEALVPFDQVIPLDVEGLAAGTYTVSVNGVTDTFTLETDNVLPEETPVPDVESTPTRSPDDDTGAISGQVWHDLCAVQGGEGGEAPIPSAGCVALEDGGYQANGVLEANEPGIGGVIVSLGRGACPAAEEMTATADSEGSYRFSGLEPGTYCVAVDALRTTNSSLLIPGEWTAPASNAGVGLTHATVTVAAGETSEGIDFGWDYQFLPLPEGQAGASKGCVDSAEFVADVTVQDNEVVPPGFALTKTWRLDNSGTCTWNEDYDLIFVAGDQMGGPGVIPLPREVVPTDTVDLTVSLIAPNQNGTYRGDWVLRNDVGETFGIPGNKEFWVQIIVSAALANGGEISGLVWSDLCPPVTGGTAPEGCITLEDGDFGANGIYDAGEPRIRGVTVALEEGACPASAVTATTTTDNAGRFRFTGLDAGIYCVFINAQASANSRILLPGSWSWPVTDEETASLTVEVFTNDTTTEIWFGWDYQAE